MRIRTIKPEFWTSLDLAPLPEPALLLAAGLLNYADDEGYFLADRRLIQAALFPLRELSRPLDGCLAELAKAGFIQLCTGSDGRPYGRVVKLLEHQNINRPTPSRIRRYWTEAGPPTPKGETPERGSEAEAEAEEESSHETAGGGGEAGEDAPDFDPLEDDAPASAAAPPQSPPPEDPAVLEFPCNGKTKLWVLRQAKLGQYEALYPHMDVPFECRKARQWLIDNPARRKTAKGMTRFLGNWLERANNGGFSGRGGGASRAREPARSSIAGTGDFSF